MFKGLWFFVKFGWKSDRRYILYQFLYQFINALIPLVTVTMPKYILDELLGPQRPEYICLYVGILLGYTLVAGCASHYLSWSVFTLRCRVGADFGLHMSRKLADADYRNLESPAFLDQREKAEKFLYGDWHGFSYVLESAINIIGQLVTLGGVIAIIASMNPWMVLLFLVLVACNSLVTAWAKKRGLALSLEQAATERRWSYFTDLFQNVRYGKEIRINTLGSWLLGHEQKYMREVLKFYRRQNSFYIKAGFCAELAAFLRQGAAYAWLVWQVLFRAMSVGDFTLYVGAAATFSGAMQTVMDSIVEVRAYGVYYEAMRDYMNIPDTMRENEHLPVPEGPHIIEFRDVSFRYPGQEREALSHISITLAPGEKLSIVGENGAGKTTFIKLLTRLYDPTEGEILLNGTDIRRFDYDAYMALFSAVFQDYQLFSLPLRENVALAMEQDDPKIEAVLRRVGLSDQLDRLPNGIDTMVYKDFDEAGFEPSGGEGQKIALARALYRDAPFVILDEPTAALDPRAEYEIYQRFNELVREKTAVYISHRLSSSRFCDRIAVFSNGGIVEYGTHEKLLQKKGLYAQLFGMQAQFYTD